MLETRNATLDGLRSTRLEQGVSYDLPDKLATRYLERGQAHLPNAEQVADEPNQHGADERQRIGDDDPITGLNARQAVARIAKLELEQLDAIPEQENRRSVLAAIAARRHELGA